MIMSDVPSQQIWSSIKRLTKLSIYLSIYLYNLESSLILIFITYLGYRWAIKPFFGSQKILAPQ